MTPINKETVSRIMAELDKAMGNLRVYAGMSGGDFVGDQRNRDAAK
ncbi:MAG: hypothetical protein HY894_09285 [Deltaproteobacteria bacterium]|nr:hypothetical protein [Deltaproteobacteria bacterium]